MSGAYLKICEFDKSGYFKAFNLKKMRITSFIIDYHFRKNQVKTTAFHWILPYIKGVSLKTWPFDFCLIMNNLIIF